MKAADVAGGRPRAASEGSTTSLALRFGATSLVIINKIHVEPRLMTHITYAVFKHCALQAATSRQNTSVLCLCLV